MLFLLAKPSATNAFLHSHSSFAHSPSLVVRLAAQNTRLRALFLVFTHFLSPLFAHEHPQYSRQHRSGRSPPSPVSRSFLPVQPILPPPPSVRQANSAPRRRTNRRVRPAQGVYRQLSLRGRPRFPINGAGSSSISPHISSVRTLPSSHLSDYSISFVGLTLFDMAWRCVCLETNLTECGLARTQINSPLGGH